jgi:hypothetical protein
VVEQLAEINENGRFTKPRAGLPEEEAKKAWAKYDEDLFQTGRLYVYAESLIGSSNILQCHLWSVYQHYIVRLSAHYRQPEQSQ